jgi:hypothetical protein
MMRDSDIDITIGQMDALQETISDRFRDNLVQLRKQPRWIERMQERGLPDKDYTRFTPDDAA